MSHEVTLGCGDYEAHILTRGGTDWIATVPAATVRWGRRIDETSDASAEGILAAECGTLLSTVRPWRHELALYRNEDRVWSGPITWIGPTGDNEVAIRAHDLTAWWDRRFVHEDHHHVAEDLAVIFQAVSDDAMVADNTPGLFLQTSPCGVLGDLEVLAAAHRKAGLILRDLANIGVDWTVVDREVLAGGLVVPSRRIGTFTDDHFAVTPHITFDGGPQSNRRVVTGQDTSGAPVVGDATDPDAAYADGLLEESDNISTIQDASSAQAAAETRLALTKAPQILGEVELAQSAPFPIHLLIPGALAKLQLTKTPEPVDGIYRLQTVAAAAGEDEKVTLVFQTVGTVP